MDIVNPDFGLIFWTTSVFILLLFLLRKFAWVPILKAVKSRNEKIEKSLQDAEKAQVELEKIKETQKSILDEARSERDSVLREAMEMKDKITEEAKKETEQIINKMKKDAAKDIENKKQAALSEIKNQMADFSISIAESLLKDELSDKEKQNKLVKQSLDNFKLN